MNDYVNSLIRTWVPIGVGAVLVYLARRWGVVLDDDTSAQLTLSAVALVTAVYYALVRALETRWPTFGRLLGRKTAPVYPAKF